MVILPTVTCDIGFSSSTTGAAGAEALVGVSLG
jgi:hypothetical protein